MNLTIIGARGIPANYGGFETFVEELSVNLIKKKNYKICVIGDVEQKEVYKGITTYKGIDLIYSKYSKTANPILFYYDSLKLACQSADIIYSCGPGVGVVGFLAKWHKKTLITNPDGLNWKRSKWSPLIQRGFRVFEWLSTKFSDYIACDSVGIEQHIQESYAYKNTFVAEYGSYINPFIGINDSQTKAVLDKYGLKPNAYHLVVSRLEPENNVETIIEGYCKEKRQFPLIIVGNLKETKFVQKLRTIANEQVLFLGGIYDKDGLSIVRANAIDYLHGHSVGGTNPSLLEAMGSRNLCICHDNVFNREVVKSENGLFFSTPNDVSDIVMSVEKDINNLKLEKQKDAVLERVRSYYNWDNITDKYHQQFQKIAIAKGITK